MSHKNDLLLLYLGFPMFNDNYTSRPTTIRFPGSGLI